MELVIKLYSEKASGVGIKFNSEYAARKSYEDLINLLGDGTLDITFEFNKQAIEMVVRNSDKVVVLTHQALSFKADQLKRLMNWYTPGSEINYLHIYAKKNVLYVARPQRQNLVLRIAAIQFFPSLNL